jgi:hypothetical protein
MMAVRSGKMPTTSVRRRISLLSRSWVVGPYLAPDLFGEGGERQELGAGGVEVRLLWEACRIVRRVLDHIGLQWIPSGWSKMECSRVRTHGQEAFGVTDIRLVV